MTFERSHDGVSRRNASGCSWKANTRSGFARIKLSLTNRICRPTNFRSLRDKAAHSKGKCQSLLQKPIEPGDRSLQCIDTVPWLAQAVALAWIANEHSLNPATLKRHVHFFGLSDVHVVVLLAVDEQRRRLRLPHIAQRRPLPKQVVIVPGKAAKLRVKQILIERSG